MLSKYRMEKANPGMEKARLTSRLNAVQQRIKEVEEQLDEARRNAAFESKYKDDPYWKIAKKRYIETGDPAAIENFRAKQDALETAEKERASREAINSVQKQKELLYDKAEATKRIRLADIAFKAAIATGDEKVEIPNAQTELQSALDYYKNVTGEDYDYKWPEGYQKVKSNDAPPAGQAGAGGDEGSWLSKAPLFAESGAKNAKEYAAYLLKYADNDNGKANKLRLSAANKQLVDNFLAANKDRWADMGLNDQDVARIKSHLSQEDHDAKTTSYNQKRLKAIQNWNRLMDDKNSTFAQKQAAYAELAKYGIKPETTASKVKLEKE